MRGQDAKTLQFEANYNESEGRRATISGEKREKAGRLEAVKVISRTHRGRQCLFPPPRSPLKGSTTGQLMHSERSKA